MHKLLKTILCGSLLTLALSPAVSASTSTVLFNDALLTSQEAWIENGVTYITLRSLTHQEPTFTLSWQGGSAVLNAGDTTLTATPGASYAYTTARGFYIPSGIPTSGGQTALPARTLAEVLSGSVTWDRETTTVSLVIDTPTASQSTYNQEDLYWLSRIIYAESGAESLTGQIAVGNVVLNRVKSATFPSTIKDVIFDTKYGVQFEPVSNGTVYKDPSPMSIMAAQMCLDGTSVVGDALYFYAPALSAGAYMVNHCTYYTTIGCHKFYLA